MKLQHSTFNNNQNKQTMKKRAELKNTIDQMILEDIYKTFHSAAEYTFLTTAHKHSIG